MKFTTSVILFLMSSLSSYLITVLSRPEPRLELEKQLVTDSQVKSSLGFGLAQATKKYHEQQTNAHLIHLDEAFSKVAFTDTEKQFLDHFGDDPSSKLLRRSFILSQHESEIPNAREENKQLIDKIKATPSTLHSIVDVLSRLPQNQFAIEKASLLMLSTSFPESSEQMRHTALQILVTAVAPSRATSSETRTQDQLNQALSGSPDHVLPVLAHHIFLRGDIDPSTALSGTLNGIVAQTDRATRQTMVIQHLQKFPNQREELETSLRERGIEI